MSSSDYSGDTPELRESQIDLEEMGESELAELYGSEGLLEDEIGEEEGSELIQEEQEEQKESQSQLESSSQDDGESEQTVVPLLNARFGTKSFKELQVNSWLIANLDTVGIKQPTLI
jgi:hypothetical protein